MMIMNVLMLVISAVTVADAFVTPSHRVEYPYHQSSSLKALPEFLPNNPFVLSDGLSASTYMNSQQAADIVTQDEFNSAMAVSGGGLSALRTFFIVITAAVFGLAGLTYITAAFIVPKAAEQLERDTKRLRPGLWEEYIAKLEEGETMANRPDLLQELGNIMQPIIAKDYEDEAERRFPRTSKTTKDDTINPTKDESAVKEKGDVIDATIVQLPDDDKQ